MSEERVTIEIHEGVADVRLNRSDKLNALDRSMFDGIVAAIDRLAETPGLSQSEVGRRTRMDKLTVSRAAIALMERQP